MAYTVTVDLHRANISAFLYTRAGPMVRAVGRWGRDVQRVARRRVDSDTGRLAASIRVETNSAPGFVYADIGSALRYAIWHHEGTGIYGSGRPIRPTRARVMRFKPGKTPRRTTLSGAPRRDTRGVVYARKVKGQPPNPYLVSALNDVMGPVARIRSFQGRARRRR